MRQRNTVLVGTLLFVLLLGGLTIDVIIRTGFDVLVFVSLAIVAMVIYGVVGAMRNPPEE